MPDSVKRALARLLETRTLASLQEKLTAEIIRLEVDKLNGVGSGYNSPQEQSLFCALSVAERQSNYLGVRQVRGSKQASGKWRVQLTRNGVTTYLGTYDDESAEGCCWVGDKFLAITKKCLEVGGYVQRWEDAAGGYQKKVFWRAVLWVPQPGTVMLCR